MKKGTTIREACRMRAKLRKLLRFTAMAVGTVLSGGWSMAVPVASGEPAGPDCTRWRPGPEAAASLLSGFARLPASGSNRCGCNHRVAPAYRE
ncbi:hypothetical protein [Burkholderia gladioli]|uniref:hypothetical protein n=1 Tax=Burkholderia gladioli TaxID=28095 RepID=UPI00039F899D|nr:hypothetical protein [Burkholderia gladioli]